MENSFPMHSGMWLHRVVAIVWQGPADLINCIEQLAQWQEQRFGLSMLTCPIMSTACVS